MGQSVGTVEWDGANELELGYLLGMAEDGYEFLIEDAKIVGCRIPG